MSTLFLDRKDIRLKKEGRAIALYENDRRTITLPLGMIERVVVRANVQLDTRVLGALGEAGTGLLIFGARSARRQALIGMPTGGDALRRVNQVRRYDDAPWCDRFAQRLVRHKIADQARLLQQALYARPDQRYCLRKGHDRLIGVLNTLSSPVDRPRLRGLEGAAAAGYFKAFTTLFAPSLGFNGRRRRPPPDPVNALLSLAYTLLHFEAVMTCLSTGLDPHIGFYHELVHARESLACDLIEPLRPRVDRWVWQLFRSESLTANHFTTQGEGIRLGKTGRQIFYSRYEAWVGPYRRALKRATWGLVKAIGKEQEAS